MRSKGLDSLLHALAALVSQLRETNVWASRKGENRSRFLLTVHIHLLFLA